MEEREETHPRPKAQRRGKARATPTLEGQRGQELCTSLVVGQQIQGGEKEGPAYKGRREWGREGGGKPALKLPASFRLATSCTFLLFPPRGSSSPQKTIFLFLLNQEVFHGILFFT